ncbi:macro domain-containing protein [Streptomyces globisporus]|uniref:hypothetical protein n=1 Tax=Streptomyces globisporus TaxID=1908 RepID=UPI00382072E9
MSEITDVRGDATAPQGKGVKLILHVCNDLGGWGKGFVLGRWSRIAPLVERRLISAGVPVTVYDHD